MGAATERRERPQLRGAWRSSEFLAPLAMVLLVLIAGAPSFGYGFLGWDDEDHVVENPLVIGGAQATLRDQLTTPQLGYPIPVTIASYRLEHALFGLAPAPYHVSNALLHACVAWLAFRLGRRLGLSLAGALLGALFFALHPAAAECVSWVTGRKDLLAALLGLCSLLLVALRPGVAGRVASVALFALALLSKPSAAPLIAMVPLFELLGAPGEPGSPAPKAFWARARRAALAVVPYLCVLVPITYLGLVGQHKVGATAQTFAPLTRAHGAWYALGHHAKLVLFAEEPTAKYLPTPWPPSAPGPVDYAGVALLALLALAVALCRERRRAVLAGVAFAGLAYLPASSLLFPLTRYLADTYVYLPLVGLGWVVGSAFDELTLRLPHRAMLERLVPLAMGLTLLPLFWSSSARFENDLALWSHARARFGHHPRVCREWANAVIKQAGVHAGLGAVDACIGQFGTSLFEKNRGLLLMELGRYAEAEDWLGRAAARTPSDPVLQRYLAAIRAELAGRRGQPR